MDRELFVVHGLPGRGGLIIPMIISHSSRGTHRGDQVLIESRARGVQFSWRFWASIIQLGLFCIVVQMECALGVLRRWVV
jgi:hypothetical protein